MKWHKKRKCPTQTICHCLVVDETNFFQCCGHYHAGKGGCGGRVNDPHQIQNARVHWDDHQP